MLDDTEQQTAERRGLARTGMASAWWARAKPDELAVLGHNGERSFAALNANANRLVRALRARGLVAGDAVALVSRNRPEWIEAYAACLRAGWRVTPVNWHLTAEEAAYVVDDCDAKALVLDGSLPAALGAVDARSDAGKVYKRRLREEYRARA